MTTEILNTREQGIFRHREDIRPILLFTLLALADFGVYLSVQSVPLLVVWLLLMAVPKIMICSWNHHHQHVPTFRNAFFNRAIELVYSFHTGITTNTWVLHHNLGHHLNYLDQTKDESGWQRPDGTKMGELEYTLKIALTGYTRAFKVGGRYPKIRSVFLSMGTLTAVLLGVLFYFNWVNALFVYAIPMVLGYVGTCWHTYSHHAGLETENPYEASYNTLHPWYNWMTGNLGYHTAHHVKPGLHWSKLPEFHASIADKIPAHLYRRSGALLSLFPDFSVCERGASVIDEVAARRAS